MTRKPAAAEPDFSSLTNLDCLALAQSVYQLGTSSWSAVAQLLSKHPSLSLPESLFTPQFCQAMYKHLTKEASLEITEADAQRHSSLNLKLAQIYYQARIIELRDLIGNEEEEYKKVASEIEQLKKDASKESSPTAAAVEDVVDLTSDLSSFSSQQSVEAEEQKEPIPTPAEAPGVLLSPHMVEKDLLNPDPEEESETTKKEEPDTEEPQRMDVGEVLTEVTPQPPSTAETPVPEESQAATPHESTAEPEPEPERMDVIEESGDEQVPKTRSAKAARRQRKATTPVQTRKTRRQSRALATTPEITETAEEEKASTPMTVDEEASPAPEAAPSSRRQSKRRASLTDDNPREPRRARADSELADDEDTSTNPSSSRRRRTENSASKRFQNMISMLHSQISAHRSGTIFHNPIRNSEAPDYTEIVKRPMDLKTIKGKIKDGAISNSLEFQRDIYLMFANAMMYNRPGSDVYNMAEDMMLESEGYIQTFRQSEGFVRGSQR